MSTVNNKFLILTDSLSSLQSLQNIFSNHLIVELIQNLYNDLTHSNITTKFMFIPSHVGISGNDTVDLLAKSATTQSPYKFPIRTDMKKFFRQISLQEWQSEWSEQTSNKLFKHKKSISPWSHLNHLDRKTEVVLTRLRLGHTRITHEYLFKKLPHPETCKFCNISPISVDHILFRCPKFTNIRKFKNFEIQDNILEINELIQYLKTSGIFPLI